MIGIYLTENINKLFFQFSLGSNNIPPEFVMNPEPDEGKQLFEAVCKNNIEKVDEILASGAINVDWQYPKENNRTALHIAAHKGRYDIVCSLVDKHNANVNIKDQDGEIPLQLATDRYHMKIVKFLLKRNSSLREYAERYLNSEQIEELFEATEANEIAKVVGLINSGVDVNSEDRSSFQRTPLEVAAALGYYDLVRVLADNGADMGHEDEIGESAYHKAVNNKYDNIANYLVENGFKVTSADSDNASDSDVSLTNFPNFDN